MLVFTKVSLELPALKPQGAKLLNIISNKLQMNSINLDISYTEAQENGMSKDGFYRAKKELIELNIIRKAEATDKCGYEVNPNYLCRGGDEERMCKRWSYGKKWRELSLKQLDALNSI